MTNNYQPRNIANVVHDLEKLIINQQVKLEFVTSNLITNQEKEEIINSLKIDNELLSNYIDKLRLESKKNNINKESNIQPF
ncbi:hypothetical protein [Cysteiniphilum litorale]|uniref:hypothetical protein n=1 Tax=Cysteiniphilum litorale TaxID=2056700 RepID=UPI003F884BC3